MNMVAINTPGKGVHVMQTEKDFHSGMIDQLMDSGRSGLAAILVANDAEARYLINEFSAYDQKFHDMTDENYSIHRTRWNIMTIDDAKGLEFSSVIVLAGRMTRNQRYIAYTRALDDLYVYETPVNIIGFQKESRRKVAIDVSGEKEGIGQTGDYSSKLSGSQNAPAEHDHKVTTQKHNESAVRCFFEEKGLVVIDRRDEGGRLWVIGERDEIRGIVNQAISRFQISGKYASSKETNNRQGWCTKTEK